MSFEDLRDRKLAGGYRERGLSGIFHPSGGPIVESGVLDDDMDPSRPLGISEKTEC